MSPWMLAASILVIGALVAAQVALSRRRRRAVEHAGLSVPRRWRSQLPAALMIAGVGLLMVSTARPQATVMLPRAAGTVVLAIDTSASMTADDVEPTRFAAAQAAAEAIVEAQPSTVDIGVVAFSGGALSTQLPSEDHSEAISALESASTSGSTSLGQAILTALSAITGETVTLDEGEDAASAQNASYAEPTSTEEGGDDGDLGYWGSATIVILSDGEQTSDPDALAAAALAAEAGVHIETIGVGTAAGATVEIDGYTVSTALDEGLLTEIATATGGTYHALADAAELDSIAQGLDLRVTAQEEEMELTPFLAAAALVLLTAGAGLMIVRTGRVL